MTLENLLLLHSMYLYVPQDFQNKEPLFPCAALTGIRATQPLDGWELAAHFLG